MPNPFGKLYTPRDVAELWQLSKNGIWPLFQDEPGVLVMGDRGTPAGGGSYCTPRIPEAAAMRVCRERGGGGQAG